MKDKRKTKPLGSESCRAVLFRARVAVDPAKAKNLKANELKVWKITAQLHDADGKAVLESPLSGSVIDIYDERWPARDLPAF